MAVDPVARGPVLVRHIVGVEVGKAIGVVSALPLLVSSGLAVWEVESKQLSESETFLSMAHELTAWDEQLPGPLGVALDGLLSTNSLLSGDCVGSVGEDILQ